ncbi:hypothetical protein [Hoeflea alexandrii]|uniref:Uncharacterized protein n=1 Tax=Hoeflea alexandrii TaxID=288436 RepID=A0ABT1CPR0_9HYPH|nr:hypothetical protein [Hoeflea alexandrii]MCO6407376.1 hypothetical protein [Hoeflea alexandrii]
MQYWNLRHNWASDIFRAGSRLIDLVADIELTETSRVVMDGYVNLKHKDIAPGAIGMSAFIGYRTAANLAALGSRPTGARSTPLWNDSTAPLTWIPGAKDGGNIRDATHHYGTLLLKAVINLPAGAYRIEPWLFAHTDSPGYTNRDDLICVNTDAGQSSNQTYGFFSGLVFPL